MLSKHLLHFNMLIMSVISLKIIQENHKLKISCIKIQIKAENLSPFMIISNIICNWI